MHFLKTGFVTETGMLSMDEDTLQGDQVQNFNTDLRGNFFYLTMTRSQINPSYESGKWMTVKVAKWSWKK